MFAHNLKKSFSFSIPAPRKLREIMKMSLIEKEPSDIVVEIWNKYHRKKEFNLAKVNHH